MRVKSVEQLIALDFHKTLQALEGVYKIEDNRSILDNKISEIICAAEIDLGVQWKHGRFLPSGAKLLDDALVIDSLMWLRSNAGLKTVLEPLEKSLRHLLTAQTNPAILSDVITDAYEALEALAKIVAQNEKTLDANLELLISRIKASDAYRRILREYISLRTTSATGHPHRRKSLPSVMPRLSLSYT